MVPLLADVGPIIKLGLQLPVGIDVEILDAGVGAANKKICYTIDVRSIYIYGTAQFKIDTRVQQTRVHLTDFVEAHASYSHAGCMAREHICTIEYTARAQAYTRHDMRELRHEARQKPIARKQMHSRG